MEEQRAFVEQPGKVSGPLAKALAGILCVLFVVGGWVLLVTGEYILALGMGGVAGAFFYALATEGQVHEDAAELRRLEPCPCCNTVVLDVGWPAQSCVICEWEIGAGAYNLGYDLPRARENFQRNGLYYQLEDRRNWGARDLTQEEKSLKARIIAVLEELQASQDRSNSADLWREFERLESELHRYRNGQAEHGA